MRFLLIAALSSFLTACAAPKAPEPKGEPFPINSADEVGYVQES